MGREKRLMWPFRRTGTSSPLLYQASTRLLWGLGVAVLVIGMLMGWVIHLSQEKIAQREINDAMEYFSDGVKDMEQQWETAAIRYKSRLEFTRMLEDPASRWAKLNSYLTTQTAGETFTALLVADSHNRVLFSHGFGEEAIPAEFTSPPDIGWFFHKRNDVLFRYYVQHIWLGAEGMGHLIMFRQMNNGLLHQLATPSTHLFLRWHGQVVASSLGEHGKTLHLPHQAGSMEHDDMRVEQNSFKWDETSPDSPELIIHRQIESLFEVKEIALGLLVGLVGLLAALWLSIGVWMRSTAGRITLVGLASRQFALDGHPSPELKHLLEKARWPRDDEINEVARSLGSLTDTVAQRDVERDVYEATLREGEAKVLEITSVLADGVYVLDRNGLVTFVNLETERLLGWTAEELLGKNGHETFHYKQPDGTPIPTESCPVHLTIQTGQSYRANEDWLVRKDGSIIPVSIVSSPILRDGKVTGSVAAFHDITLRLEAQKALRESEEKFRLISTSAMDAIIIIGSTEEITYWNPAAENIFGYQADEALGKNMHRLITPPRHRDDSHRGFEHFRTSGEGPVVGKTLEMTALRKDGEEFPIEMSISAFRIKEQWQALGIVRDISERKKAEQEYKTIIQTTIDGFVVVDAYEGRFLDVNDAYCRILGYSREEILRMRTSDVEVMESPEQVKQHIAELRKIGQAQFETRQRCKDGKVLDVDISATYLDIRGGVLIVFIRDISERKRAEEQIRQLAYYDTLTNLPNRRLMLDRLDQSMSQAKRFQRSMAVVFLDLDHFKLINDTLGHDVGDELLKVAATRLNACVRNGDIVSRQGGDEFVIVLAEISHPQDAAVVAEKIIDTLAQPVSVNGRKLQITTSIGIAVYPLNGTDDTQELMKKADMAMYAAKEGGRNGYRFYQD
jgi:diguanylate cyclase (GGDEF)-like protein/PAS domain S-box-containing protein